MKTRKRVPFPLNPPQELPHDDHDYVKREKGRMFSLNLIVVEM